jgi:hypothetical protein
MQQYSAGARECRYDVDMAAGAKLVVVTSQSSWQPNGLGGTQRRMNFVFDAFLGCPRIAARIELNGFGQQDGCLTVYVETAALIHQ